MEDLPSIQQLECFVHYGRAKNFTLAAREASITQSAFSAQIKKLEQAVGVLLIRRSKRGSCLTPAGERFLPEARAWLEELRRMIVALRMEEGAPVELDVGILRMLGDVQMNAHIAHFERENAGIRFHVFDLEEEQLEAALCDGRIDVASTYLTPEEEAALPGEGFALRHFCWDTMVCYAPLVALSEAAVSRAALAALPMVYYAGHSHMNDLMARYFAGLAAPAAAAHLSTPYAMMMYCEENSAAALLPERLLRAMGRAGGWRTLAEPLRCDACLVYREKSPKMDAIRIYVDHVLQSFREKGSKDA